MGGIDQAREVGLGLMDVDHAWLPMGRRWHGIHGAANR
jgi:hypothetical protein